MFKKLFLLVTCSLPYYSMTMTPNSFITFISGFDQPYAIAITPNSLYAYVTNFGSKSVQVINTDSSSPNFNTLVTAPNLVGVFDQPNSIAITPNGLYAYVTNGGSNSISIINTDPSSPNFNDLVAAPNLVGVFDQPNSIAITPNGSYAYVTNAGNNSVSVIDLNPSSPTYNQVIATPALAGILSSPFDIAITPNGNYAYIANLTGSVTVIDINLNTPVTAPGLAAVNAQPEGLSITADSKFAYVTNGAATDVTVLDIDPTSATFNTVLSIPSLSSAFNYPNDVATTLSGNYYAYVTNFIGSSGSISSVSVIDINPASPTYNTTLDTPGLNIPTLTRFVTLAMTPNGRFVYAVDIYNNNVGVIYTGMVLPPSNFTGCTYNNTFLLQKTRDNYLTWSAPTMGTAPAFYRLYGDSSLTQLITTVPATTLQYNDYSMNDTYYITSVDDLGNSSSPASTTVTTVCS